MDGCFLKVIHDVRLPPPPQRLNIRLALCSCCSSEPAPNSRYLVCIDANGWPTAANGFRVISAGCSLQIIDTQINIILFINKIRAYSEAHRLPFAACRLPLAITRKSCFIISIVCCYAPPMRTSSNWPPDGFHAKTTKWWYTDGKLVIQCA